MEKKLVRVQAAAAGKGHHDFSIRVLNAVVAEHKKPVNLKAGQKIEIIWDIAVTNPEVPWVAVILPDGDLTLKQELTGIPQDP